jgi:hypothetical protein
MGVSESEKAEAISANIARPLSRGIHAADASGVVPTAMGW